ncbi:MAG: hypothetical protein ABIE74_07220 [Pseudomonadota bacterium]
MQFKSIQPNLVRYQMRMVQGENPHEQAQKRPGAFGRFLSGFGKIMGAVAAPLSFIFPPAAIGAAGMYGLGQIGDQVQARAYTRQIENVQKQKAMQISFPGLGNAQGNVDPVTYGVSMQDQQVTNVLFQRDAALNDMNQKLLK